MVTEQIRIVLEEVLNRVRVNGIGPLMVQPATPHIDTSLGGPIDIQHYQQWATTPPGSQFGNPMLFNSPVEMPPFGVAPILSAVAPSVSLTSESLGPLGASVFSHYSPQHSSLTASSHGMSSPTSCSE
ncbi:hypothetical protein CAEBREN_30685 [Caenorhabditis brenneri]|uniref:Uncharacterized protein n=1 Tax=Caenorhabditis brenneri TaxID=135651 RepID=G0NPZ7_CAEBE|nr:hypothetical protein CAEBREN_30685 [Caenorhabditis brenneri]